MRLFQTRKPRAFNLTTRFANDPRERMREMEKDMRTLHGKRRGMSHSTMLALIVLLALLVWIVAH